MTPIDVRHPRRLTGYVVTPRIDGWGGQLAGCYVRCDSAAEAERLLAALKWGTETEAKIERRNRALVFVPVRDPQGQRLPSVEQRRATKMVAELVRDAAAQMAEAEEEGLDVIL